MIAGGETTRTGPPTLRVRASLLAAGIAQLVAIALLGTAVLFWFLRGAQLAHYRRALRRHEAGHCPHCDYDISAAPDALCPECGCDHRAVRREAVEVLGRGGRRRPNAPASGTP